MTESECSVIIRLFDTQEKWDAFLDLWYVKDNLCNHWFNITVDMVRELIEKHPNSKTWIVSKGYYWIKISPQKSGQESLSINVDFSDRLASLWINANRFDTKMISKGISENLATLLPCLPGFATNDHPWCPMLKTIPSDIINNDKDKRIFDSFMYGWGEKSGDVAERIYSEFFEPVLGAEVDMAEILSKISSIAQRTI